MQAHTAPLCVGATVPPSASSLVPAAQLRCVRPATTTGAAHSRRNTETPWRRQARAESARGRRTATSGPRDKTSAKEEGEQESGWAGMQGGLVPRSAAAAAAALWLPQLCASLASQRDLNAVRRGPALTGSVSPGLRRLCSSPLATFSAREAMGAGRRWAASYPTPNRRKGRTKPRKVYNYLTHDRLVQRTSKVSDAALREIGDQRLIRRRNYKALMQRDVAEKIRFFSPELKALIFYPRQRNSDRRSLFRGHRDFPSPMTARLHAVVLAELRKRANRNVILEVLAEQNVEPPTDEDWATFTDPATGDINTGLMYSQWVLGTLSTCGSDLHHGMTTRLRRGANQSTVAYLLRHFDDITRVPSVEEWAHEFGPVREDELVWRHKADSAARLKMMLRKNELRLCGQATVLDVVSHMPIAEQEELVRVVEAQLEKLYAAARRHHLFAAKILLVLHSLPEGRAVAGSRAVFAAASAAKHVIEMKGEFYPMPSHQASDYLSLSPEERLKYTCFGRSHRCESMTGRRLFLRYCCRDYGFSLADAWRRFTELDDLQKAALEFPFFTSIAPKIGIHVAFQRFYAETCERLGFGVGGASMHSNRVLRCAIRKRWEQLSVAERQRYHQSTALRGVFPLQPDKSDAAPTAAAEAAAAAAPEENGSAAARDATRPPTATVVQAPSTAAALPVSSAPSDYFVDERPPSLQSGELDMTESDLLAEFQSIVAGVRQRRAAAAAAALPDDGASGHATGSEVAANAAPHLVAAAGAAVNGAEASAAADGAPSLGPVGPAATHATSTVRRLKAPAPRLRQPAVRVVMI